MEASNPFLNALSLPMESQLMVESMNGSLDDLAMEFTVNGIDMLPYIKEGGLKITLRAIDGPNAGRVMDSTMYRDLVAYKLEISVDCKPLPLYDAMRVCMAIIPEYVLVTLVCPFCGRITAQFYSNNIPTVCNTVGENGETLWDGIEYPLIQR